MIEGVRRRPEGPKLLVYLDQSMLSDLVREPTRQPLRDLLTEGVRSDRIVCPLSQEHRDEALLADKGLWDELDRLGDELSLGVHFEESSTAEWQEIHAAARECLSEPEEPLWQEAFAQDPHTPRDSLFVSGLRVRARFEPERWQQAEVDHERDKEEGMTDVYAELRAKGFSFEEMADGNTDEMIYWKLGWLFDPQRWAQRATARVTEFGAALASGADPLRPGSQYLRYQALATDLTRKTPG